LARATASWRLRRRRREWERGASARRGGRIRVLDPIQLIRENFHLDPCKYYYLQNAPIIAKTASGPWVVFFHHPHSPSVRARRLGRPSLPP
jgi:hypothetical protein